jgi:signal peptidase I
MSSYSPPPMPPPPATNGNENGSDSEHAHSSQLRSTIEWLAIIVGSLVIALIIKAFLLQTFYIPSESMEPNLLVGDRVLVNKLGYRFHEVGRGDIVVFERPPEIVSSEIKDLIKRVIALPGETIEGDADGQVLINGRVLDEPYLAPGMITENLTRHTVPPNSYWVMGDNRDNSGDSRRFGAIPKDAVVGRAFVRIWPLSALGLL